VCAVVCVYNTYVDTRDRQVSWWWQWHRPDICQLSLYQL